MTPSQTVREAALSGLTSVITALENDIANDRPLVHSFLAASAAINALHTLASDEQKLRWADLALLVAGRTTGEMQVSAYVLAYSLTIDMY